MSAFPASRVNYFDRQYLRLSELTDEQAYHLQLHRRHNLSHHSWGIVVGLQLVQQDKKPVVLPGLAVDGYGRELLMLDRKSYDRSEFDRLGTNRIDLWLEYRLGYSNDPAAPFDCNATDPRQAYRAIEFAEVIATRAGARPDPRHPTIVPADDQIEPLLATPDDPALRWPVYLGRIIMQLPETGDPEFNIEDAGRAYAGLNAEIIDHPGNPCRIELGRTSDRKDKRTIGVKNFTYAAGAGRDFALFVPDSNADQDATDPPALHPVISVRGPITQVLGSMKVTGHVQLEGTSLQFMETAGTETESPDTDGHPSLYRGPGDELRIDVGELNNADRSFVLGVSKDGKFNPAVTVTFPGSMTGTKVNAKVTVHGDLHIDGTIECPDIRTRTISEDVAALLTGMIQAAIASGGS